MNPNLPHSVHLMPAPEGHESLGAFLKVELPSGGMATIFHEFGCIVNEWQAEVLGNLYPIFAGYDDLEAFEKLSYSRGVNLSPFPNRIEDGEYSFDGSDYQLPINKVDERNAIHGLLQKAKYEIVGAEELMNGTVLRFKHLYAGSPAFPWEFELEKTIRLTDNQIHIHNKVTNLSNDPMPYGDGWHPYFVAPSGSVNDCELELATDARILVDERMIPTGETESWYEFPLNGGEEIGGHKFDDGFTTQFTGNMPQAVVRNEHYQIELWQSQAYPYLQVYIPPNRQSIALEPMSCATNAFNNGMGLVVLGSEESWEGEYQITVNP